MTRTLILLGVSLMAATAQAAPTVLVRNGQANCYIVWQPNSATRLQAAEDLQRCLRVMSGAKVPLYTADMEPPLEGGVRIEVGSPARSFKPQETLVAIHPNEVLLAGDDAGDHNGSAWATYAFLMRLGCRWYMPGKFGEVIPKRKTVAVTQGVTREQPDFAIRHYMQQTPPELSEDDRLWRLRNRMSDTPDFDNCGDGSWAMWIRTVYGDQDAPEKLAAENPEFFAFDPHGEIDAHMPNLSNPDGPRWYAQILLKALKKTGRDSIAFCPDDGMPRDYRPESLALNLGIMEPGFWEGSSGRSISEEWFAYANAVCKEVRKVRPDVYIGSNGYANRDRPPEGIEFDDHFVLMYAPLWCCNLHEWTPTTTCPQGQLAGQWLQRWCELLPGRVWLYQYVVGMHHTALSPVPRLWQLRLNLPWFKELGVLGFMDESRRSWAEDTIPARWLRAQLYWNANADTHYLLTNFCERWYGPDACDSMYDYWTDLSRDVALSPIHGRFYHILPQVYVSDVRQHLDTATKAVAKNRKYRERVKADAKAWGLAHNWLEALECSRQGKFRDALERLASIREGFVNLNAISPWYAPADEFEHESGMAGRSISRKQSGWERLAGDAEKAIAWFGPGAQIARDRDDRGMAERWGDGNGFPRVPWYDVTQQPWYLYLDEREATGEGFVWYRFVGKTEALAAKAAVVLPECYGDIWVWLDGKFLGERGGSTVRLPIEGLLARGSHDLVVRCRVTPVEFEGLMARPFIMGAS